MQFEEEGIFNKDTHARFHDTVLATGGSRPAAKLCAELRGCELSIEALLRYRGIAA